MLIGLTFDLREEYLAAGYSELQTAEFDRADTIDSIEAALKGLGHEVDRVGHARNLVSRLSAGTKFSRATANIAAIIGNLVTSEGRTWVSTIITRRFE